MNGNTVTKSDLKGPSSSRKQRDDFQEIILRGGVRRIVRESVGIIEVHGVIMGGGDDLVQHKPQRYRN